MNPEWSSAEDKKDALIQGPLGRTQKMTIINDSGLYALVLSSSVGGWGRDSRVYL